MARQFRVTWVNGPDGRIIDSVVRHSREDAERIVVSKLPLIGENELLVFEVEENDA